MTEVVENVHLLVPGGWDGSGPGQVRQLGQFLMLVFGVELLNRQVLARKLVEASTLRPDRIVKVAPNSRQVRVGASENLKRLLGRTIVIEIERDEANGRRLALQKSRHRFSHWPDHQLG